MARSSAIQSTVPSARSPAIRSITGPSAAEQHRYRQVGDVERVVDAEAVVLDVDRVRAREHRVEHVEVVLDQLRRLLVGQPEHVVDDPVVRRSDPEA